MKITAGDVVATLDGEAGGILTSVRVGDLELLHIDGGSGRAGGCFPMVPWAGRIRHGRFLFDGTEIKLPLNMAPHAIHGTGFESRWREVEPNRLTLDLVDPWPFGGSVEQWIELAPERLTLHMAVTAERRMPVLAGWHPWFPRHRERVGAGHGGAGRGPGESSAVQIGFEAASMYELDEELIPTGRLIEPPPGPWDNCFTALSAGPTLVWPGVLELALDANCDHWVIYDQPTDTVCVEPQSGPPDAFNHEPHILDPGERFELEFTMSWRLLDP